MALDEKLRRRQGERLRELKRENHLTQAQLGEVLHVTQQQVSKLMTGKSLLQPDQAEALAREFGVRPQWLLAHDGYKTKAALADEKRGKFLENAVVDLAREAGLQVSLVSWTQQDEVSQEELGRLSRINMVDPKTGVKRSFDQTEVADLIATLAKVTKFLFWESVENGEGE